MNTIPYFGYGTNRDHDMMAAMIGRNNLSGAKGVIFDYDRKGKIVGIEVLDASKKFPEGFKKDLSLKKILVSA